MDGLTLWKTLACFGQEQTTKVLQDPRWRNVYPELFEVFDSATKRTKYDTTIPLPLLKEIASTEPSLYIFAFREEELICRDVIARIPSDFKIITPLEALERFGGDLMLEAVDYGTSKVT
jgi:hypothetical protein